MRCNVRDAFAKFSQKAGMKPILNTGSSRTRLAFRTRLTAPTHACSQTGAATTRQNDPIRAERHHLLNGFVHRLRTRPRLSRARRHFFSADHCIPQCASPLPLRTSLRLRHLPVLVRVGPNPQAAPLPPKCPHHDPRWRLAAWAPMGAILKLPQRPFPHRERDFEKTLMRNLNARRNARAADAR